MRTFLLQTCFILTCALSLGSADAAINGITYKNYSQNGTTPVHVLNIDPTKVKIIAARAQDIGSDLESVANIAKHFSAIAAINGGFFKYNDPGSIASIPAGVLKINNYWYGIAYQPRGAIGWDPLTNVVLMDRLQTKSSLTINHKPMPLNAMNRIATNNKAYLISRSFIEPINVAPHTAIIFSDNKIDQIVNSGEISIPENSYLYHLGTSLHKQPLTMKIGDPVNLQILALPQINKDQATLWNKLPFITGGGPLLISNNKVINDFTNERQRVDFINNKYARTAIGILPNKHWILVVAEYNMLIEDSGMTIPELASFMKSLGCVMAVNLDGGGSSAMYVDPNLADTSIFSHPVADVILVLPR